LLEIQTAPMKAIPASILAKWCCIDPVRDNMFCAGLTLVRVSDVGNAGGTAALDSR
jgi:hypothetical protein